MVRCQEHLYSDEVSVVEVHQDPKVKHNAECMNTM